MSSNCYNSFAFYGNSKVLDQIQKWNESLKAITPTAEDKFCARAIKKVFYPDVNLNEVIDFGSSLLHPFLEIVTSYEAQIGLLSSGNSPNQFQIHLTKCLSKYDKNVIIENFYGLDDGGEGYVYTAPKEDEEIYCNMIHVDCEYDNFEDSLDAENDAHEKLQELRLKAIENLISEVSGSAEIIKINFPELKIDWTKFK